MTMRHVLPFSILLLTLNLLSACGGNAEKPSTEKSSVDNKSGNAATATDAGLSSVTLDGLYATSTKLPHAEYNPEKLLDGTPAYWATMPGAAPDEGVMLYFPNTAISKFEIKQPADDKGSKVSRITAFTIYVNGQALPKPVKGDAPVDLNQTLTSLFIRISQTENMVSGKKTEKQQDELGESSSTLLTEKYASGLPVGIEELIFYRFDGKPIKILAPLSVKGNVTASSSLKPVEAYHTDFLFDSRKDFGWAEGNPKSGVGESLVFALDELVTIEKIQLSNGYQRSESHYTSNERLKKFTFGLSGEAADEYEATDSQAPQTVTLKKPLQGKSFELKVSEVFAGAKYTDLVLSELRFYNGKQWFIIQSGGEERRKSELLTTVGSSVLKNILDRRWFDGNKSDWDDELGDNGTSQSARSIILRSNGSFVVWAEAEEIRNINQASVTSKKFSTVADGNWEIKSLSPTQATVRIFGQLHRVRDTENMYKGSSPIESIKIFQDELTITPKVITGKKVFDKLTLE